MAPSMILSTLRQSAIRSAVRPARFSTTTLRLAKNSTQEKDSASNANDRAAAGNTIDPQAGNLKKAKDLKASGSGEGGTAVHQRDAQNATQKAKQEHPEAPDTVIGMQDERGSRGA